MHQECIFKWCMYNVVYDCVYIQFVCVCICMTSYTYQTLFSCQQQKTLVDSVFWEELHYLLETAAAVMVVSHLQEMAGLIS